MWITCELHIIGILRLWIVFGNGNINIEDPQENSTFCRKNVMKKKIKSKESSYGFFYASNILMLVESVIDFVL